MSGDYARTDANGRSLIYPDSDGYACYEGKRISVEEYVSIVADWRRRVAADRTARMNAMHTGTYKAGE